MLTDILLLLCGAICMLVGLAGCILPVLPGVTLSYIGILLLQWSSVVDYSWTFLIVWGVIVLLVQVLDVLVPMWGTQRFGGGRLGAWGCAVGAVLGIFIFPPWGLILGPFVGAMLGELLSGKSIDEASRAGFGSFIGFLAGTLMKLTIAVVLSVIFFKAVILYFW